MPDATPVAGDDRVLAGVLPAGRYATVRYTGHPDGIINAVADLRGWAEQEGLAWDMARGDPVRPGLPAAGPAPGLP